MNEAEYLMKNYGDRGEGSRSPTNGDQTDLEDTGVIEEEAGPLDYAISEEGIDFAIKKLKLNKAPGCDKILNEVLKTGKDIIWRFVRLQE